MRWDITSTRLRFYLYRSTNVEDIRGHIALAFDLDQAAFLELEFAPQTFVEALRHLDASGNALRFHAAGGVDRISP